MAHDPKDLELIDKYLLQELTAAEQAEFEKRSQDPDFQEELKFHQDMQPVVKLAGREDLKADLKDLEARIALEEQSPKREPKIVQMRRWLAVAAILAGLIFIGNYFFNSQNRSEQLFAQYYKPYPNVIAPIVKSGEEVSDDEEAFQLYQLGKYEEAELLFSKLPEDEVSQFYYGLTLLELGKIDLAKEKLSIVSETIDARFQIPAKWYLGLVHLKKEELEQAKMLLEEVAKVSAYPVLQKDAQKILEALSN